MTDHSAARAADLRTAPASHNVIASAVATLTKIRTVRDWPISLADPRVPMRRPVNLEQRWSIIGGRKSDSGSPADKSQQNHHDGDNQKNVNEATHGVGSEQPAEPQYE
jgi:hypothetical protein